MITKEKYRIEFDLNGNDLPVKRNLETGQVSSVNIEDYNGNIPEGYKVFDLNISYKQEYPNGWNFLMKYLTSEEFFIACVLARRALPNTNSLKPFNDSTTMVELSRIFGVSRNVLKEILAKLLNLGVYSKFNIHIKGKPYTKYWVFNPYLTAASSHMKTDIINLFKDTQCQIAFDDENYLLTDEQIIEFKIKPSTQKRRKNID